MVMAAVLLAGCRVDATVRVRVHDDGSGTVTVAVRLDRAAVAAAGGSPAALGTSIRLEDLAAGGWAVTPWTAAAGGGATVELSKPFADPAELPKVIAELNGAHGPLRAIRLTRTESFFSVDFATSAVVDLRTVTAGVAADPELVAALGAHGVEPAALEAALTADAASLHVTYAVSLPGGDPHAGTTTGGHRAVVVATSSLVDRTRVIAVIVAAVLTVLAVLVLVLGALRTRHRRRSTAG